MAGARALGRVVCISGRGLTRRECAAGKAHPGQQLQKPSEPCPSLFYLPGAQLHASHQINRGQGCRVFSSQAQPVAGQAEVCYAQDASQQPAAHDSGTAICKKNLMIFMITDMELLTRCRKHLHAMQLRMAVKAGKD